DAWSKLHLLKEKYPTIPILAMTATLAYEDIILFYNQLHFNSNNMATIQVDVFHRTQNTSVRKEVFDELLFYTDPIKSGKPKILKNNDLATLALTNLVVHGLVNQKIVLQYSNGHTYCKLVITGLTENARLKVKAENWYYW
ncbi:25818_t:CDS:2, partial [Gigaspora rosea]